MMPRAEGLRRLRFTGATRVQGFMRPQAFSLFRASNGLGYVEVYPKPQDLNPKFRVCCGLGF